MTDGIQKVPALAQRPETGPMQFGDDWPGVFIRGDNALFLARQLGAVETVMENTGLSRFDTFALTTVKNLARLLHSCSRGNTGWPPNVGA